MQRRTLLHEIAQFWDEWADEGTVELAIAALEEPDDKVRGYALLCAKAAFQSNKTIPWLTPERRARIVQALVRAMARYEERPKELFWADRYVELLGLTASGSDKRVLERLERLRPYAGSARRTVVEKLDPDHLPYPYPANFPADVIKPGFRVSSLGTGLLDIEVLETALKRIRARS